MKMIVVETYFPFSQIRSSLKSGLIVTVVFVCNYTRRYYKYIANL